MSLNWAILAPQIKGKIGMGWFPCTGWDTIFKLPSSFNAWDLFINPLKTTPKVSVVSSQFPPRSVGKSNYGQLGTLPMEILFQILFNLEEVDVVSLGLTNRNWWQTVLGHVQHSAKIHGLESPLAGVRIACCAPDVDDLPAGFIEDNLLQSAIIDSLDNSKDISARSLIYSSMIVFDHIKVTDFVQQWRQAFIKARENHSIASSLGQQTTNKLETELAQCYSLPSCRPRDSMYALRSLTGKEYALVKRLAPRAHVPEHQWDFTSIDSIYCTLEDVVLVSTSWGSRHELVGTFKYFRGPWAGHAIDVVPLKQFKRALVQSGEHWKDVTKETAKLVQENIQTAGMTRAHPLW